MDMIIEVAQNDLSRVFVLAMMLAFAVILFRLKFKRGYKSREKLLTNAELNFYKQLARNVNSKFHIHTKVRLADLVDAGKRDKSLLHKVQAKHVDYVICSERTSDIILCIELDDSSHLSSGAYKRDSEKNYALKSAGIPLVRVRAARAYKSEVFSEINQIIRECKC